MPEKKPEKEIEKKDSRDALARFFYWLYDTIIAADKPIQMVVIILLPFLAPVPPANIIKKSLISNMEFTTFEANIAALVLVMLGYAGVIAAVSAYVKAKKDAENKAAIEERNLYMVAWCIYLASITAISVILEVQNGASLARVVVLVSLTLGTEVAAGILNASRIANRDTKEEELFERERLEKREDKIRREKGELSLKRAAIKSGVNVFALDTHGEIAQNARQDAQDTKRNTQDARMINRFQKELGIIGDWRIDEGKLSKKDLEWLQNAQASDIMLACNVKRRSAQLWRERARVKLM